MDFAKAGDLKTTVAELKAINAELQKNKTLQKEFGTGFSNATKSVSTNLDEIVAKTKKYQDALKVTSDAKEIARLTKEISSLRNEYERLSKTTNDMLVKNQKLAQEEAKTRQQNAKAMREENKLRDDAVKKQQKEAKEKAKLNSLYAQESARLNDLRKRYKDLALAEQGSSKEARNLLREITALDKKLKDVDARTGQFQRNVGNYGSAFRGIGSQLLGLAGIGGFSAIIGGAIKANAEFGQSMADLKAITGATDEQLKFFQETAIGQASSFDGSTASATEYTEALKLIASAKPELLENERALKEITDQALLLADASGLELPDAATRLTDAMNQFGAGADQAGKFVDVLAAGAKFGSAEIPQITEALLEFGSVAKSSNVTIQESTAAIEALAERGIKGAEAGTKFRNILVSLSAAKGLPKEAQESFKRVGIDVNILSDNSLTLEERLTELSKAQDDEVAMLKIFGKENITAAKTVLAQTNRIADLTQKVDENGIAQEQAAIRTDTLAGEWKKLGNAWEAEMLKMGNSAGGLTNLIRTIRENLSTIISTIMKLAKAFVVFKTAQLGMKLFAGATDIATTSWKNLNTAMKANVVALVAVAVYELADALGAFESKADALNRKISDGISTVQKWGELNKSIANDELQKAIELQDEKIRIAESEGKTQEEITKIRLDGFKKQAEIAERYRQSEAENIGKYGEQVITLENSIAREKEEILDKEAYKNLSREEKTAQARLKRRISDWETELEIAKGSLSESERNYEFYNEIVRKSNVENQISTNESNKEIAESVKTLTDKQISEANRKAEELKRIELDLKRWLEDLQDQNIEDERKREIAIENRRYEREKELLEERYSKIGKLTAEQEQQKESIKTELLKENERKRAEINKKFDDERLKKERERLETLNEIRSVNLEEETFLYESFLEEQNQARQELREEYEKAKTEEERQAIKDNFDFNTEAIIESIDSEYELRKRAIEEQRDFELTNAELKEEDKQLIKEKSDLELLKLEKQYNKDLEKLSKERVDNDKDESKKREDLYKQTIDDLKELTQITLSEIEKRVEANINGIEEDISAQEDNIERQRELAEQGLENTLAFEKQVQAENEARLLEEQRRLEKIKKVEAYYNLLASYAETDPNSAPAKALAQIAIAEAIAGRFEHGGIVSEEVAKQNGGILKGASHKRGGILIEAEGDEGIFSKKEMRNLGKDNFHTLKKALGKPVEANFMKNQSESMITMLPQHQVKLDFSELKNELRQVKSAIENKPVPSFTIDRDGNMITKSETKNLIHKSIQKRKRI